MIPKLLNSKYRLIIVIAVWAGMVIQARTAQGGIDLTGDWDTSWTGTGGSNSSAKMSLVQRGNEIIGSYGHDKGGIEGRIEGNRFIYQWHSDNGDGKGYSVIVNPNRLEGEWGRGTSKEWSGSWYANRIASRDRDSNDFPGGVSSFADSVIRYDPLYSGGPAPSDSDYTDPSKAVGPPDYAAPIGSVSLGRGGLLELQFIDNVLTNSGDGAPDLHIFEIGPDVEGTFVAIRPTLATAGLLDPKYDSNGDGFYEIGKVSGSTSSIDIDAFFPGHAVGTLLFDAVQLIDEYNEGNTTGVSVGADIDSVGAIQSVVVREPELKFLVKKGTEFVPAPAEGVTYGEIFFLEAEFDLPPENKPVQIELEWDGMKTLRRVILHPVRGSSTVFRSEGLFMDAQQDALLDEIVG